jgi:hypothetical protein
VKRESCIWVLVAGHNEARIYSSDHGVYQLDATMLAAGEALGRSARRTFQSFVADVLRDGACEGAYDGLIVVAPPDVSRDLRRELGPEMTPLVIGEIAGAAATAAAERFLTPQWIQ